MTNVTVQERLAEIKARAERATSGPWSRQRSEGDMCGFKRGVAVAATYGRQMIWADPPGGSYPSADADFIAHARTDVPALVELCEALLAVYASEQKCDCFYKNKCRACEAKEEASAALAKFTEEKK